MGRLTIRVQPGARRTGLAGWHDGLPRLAVTAPPVDGAANRATLAALAKVLGVRPRQVRLLSGHSARVKVFEVDGLDTSEIQRRVLEANPSPAP